ncbi:phosphatidylserine/phosphatidylglycerophosphate/cardiolipin synthase family protein [Altererythrobacter arenosus]|uniref:Phospholipase D n=1 Tax=Altererythrobacter arenosus TaxID=3032592 RepID=A0ABY8FMJ9_9SPHN|nr:phosphatidylserine/phosphatidylglycerophosphate/cardiolipin synthase family protein [Altererythrobacter sp. CAU 1644]WFL75997.1 phosphatidylserine/phosphatidylglycerophosphate/cardiolipin synthase family protein [Altererythrobacter sp. CAU 1644]
MGGEDARGIDVRDFRDPPVLSIEAAGHGFEILAGGRDRLDALLAMIDGAQHTLSLAFYIFDKDHSGWRVLDALVSAARRGVEVKLIVDGFGASGDDSQFRPLVLAGGKFWLFSPKWTRRFLIRNHQKIVIADGERAMVGGFNVGDDYFASPQENGWNDLGLIVEGPVVDQLEEWFAKLESWVSSRKAQWLAIRRAVREWSGGEGAVKVLIGGPTARLSSWALSVRRDLDGAQRLDLMMAYFSPSNGMMRKIAAIARRGRARLVMAGKSDNGATIGATRSLYTYLLDRGAELHEFQACKLHTKLLVIDDVTYIGSANFDMRSLYLNLEIMLRIEDAALAAKMREHVDWHVAGAENITRESHRKKATLFNRIRWNLAWFLVSVVDYTVSRRLNLGL